MSVRKGGQVIVGTPNITTGHHVGEIFWTSRLDNELNGAVDADGAVYNVEAFTGEQSVPELLRKGSLPSVSMAEYESIVSANGSCRAWGYDGGDTFRVPLLKDGYLTMVQLTTGVKEDATQLKEYKFNNPHFFGQSMWTDVEPKNSSLLVSNGEYHSGKTYLDYYKWLTNHIGETITANGGKIVTTNDEYTDYDWIINTSDSTFRLPLLNGSANVGFSNSQTRASFYQATGNGTLYYYVGDTVQDPALINASGVLDYFSKLTTVHCVVDTFKSGSSWYRVYDDGWVEQGGIQSNMDSSGIGQRTISLLKPFADTNYSVQVSWSNPATQSPATVWTGLRSRAVGSFVINKDTSTYVTEYTWQACGYGA